MKLFGAESTAGRKAKPSKVGSKCPTCGRVTGGPFTTSEFLALYPELQAPTESDVPADVADLEQVALRLHGELAHVINEWGAAKVRVGRVQGAELVVAEERLQFFELELEDLSERWRHANVRYADAMRSHTERKAAAVQAANRAVFDADEVERKRRVLDRGRSAIKEVGP